MSKLYTKNEIVSAIKAGKTAFSMQIIEGRPLLTEIYGKLDSFVQFLALVLASVLIKSRASDIESILDELKSETLHYYKQNKDLDMATHNLKETL